MSLSKSLQEMLTAGHTIFPRDPAVIKALDEMWDRGEVIIVLREQYYGYKRKPENSPLPSKVRLL